MALTMTIVSLIGYSAMVGAVRRRRGSETSASASGYQRFNPEMMVIVVVVLIVLVQVVQRRRRACPALRQAQPEKLIH